LGAIHPSEGIGIAAFFHELSVVMIFNPSMPILERALTVGPFVVFPTVFPLQRAGKNFLSCNMLLMTYFA
jgi:hypothetical protein